MLGGGVGVNFDGGERSWQAERNEKCRSKDRRGGVTFVGEGVSQAGLGGSWLWLVCGAVGTGDRRDLRQ